MISRKDVDIVCFRRGKGPGGQNRNKVATSVRMTHRATGVQVTAVEERSLGKNLQVAYGRLEARLKTLHHDWQEGQKRDRYEAKPDAAFGHQVRTYHALEQVATDHRTGVKVPFQINGKTPRVDLGRLMKGVR